MSQSLSPVRQCGLHPITGPHGEILFPATKSIFTYGPLVATKNADEWESNETRTETWHTSVASQHYTALHPNWPWGLAALGGGCVGGWMNWGLDALGARCIVGWVPQGLDAFGAVCLVTPSRTNQN